MKVFRKNFVYRRKSIERNCGLSTITREISPANHLISFIFLSCCRRGDKRTTHRKFTRKMFRAVNVGAIYYQREWKTQPSECVGARDTWPPTSPSHREWKSRDVFRLPPGTPTDVVSSKALPFKICFFMRFIIFGVAGFYRLQNVPT